MLMSSLHPRRSVLSLAGLAATAATLAACSSDKGGSGSSPAAEASGAADTSMAPAVAPTSSVPTGMPEGKGSGQADGVFPRTVVHFLGSTDIPAAPTKVVILSTGQLDGVLTLGTVPVGATTGKGADLIPAYIKEAFSSQSAELDKIADVGSRTEPSVEAIGNLSPDLILVNSAGKDAESLYASLSAVAPTVVTQGKGTNWKQDFLLVADALGKADAAHTWLDTYHADAAEAGGSIDQQATVSLLRKDSERLRIFGPISFAGSVLADMGAARPSTQTFTDDVSQEISAEQLDQADGDWLLYGVQGGDASQLTSADLWPALRAVDADHAVQVDDDPFFLNAGPTAARLVMTKVSETVKK